MPIEKTCDNCGESFETYPSRDTRFCSEECYGEWRSEELTGENNPNWDGGKKQLRCTWCETEFERWESLIPEKPFCSYSCRAAWESENRVGENHHQYKGHEDYYGVNWHKVRRKVLERDAHKCRICGADKVENGRSLDVHHVTPIRKFDEPERANTLDNLITLCRTHHRLVESGRIDCPDPSELEEITTPENVLEF